MRNTSLLKLMSLFFMVALFAACSGNSEQKDDTAFDPSYQPPAPSTNIGSSVTDNPEENSHYICADRCKGSGSDQPGTCPVCGKEYMHNDDFHKNEQAPEITLDPNNQNQQNIDLSTIQPPTPPTLSPQELEALKAKGPEYTAHYTCPSHCKGSGGEQPGSCPKCGTEYVHN